MNAYLLIKAIETEPTELIFPPKVFLVWHPTVNAEERESKSLLFFFIMSPLSQDNEPIPTMKTLICSRGQGP